MKTSIYNNLYFITAATSLIQSVSRTQAASWPVPLVFSYQAIFIKNPANIYNYAAYLEPMLHLTWIIVIVFLIFVPPCLYLVFAYNPNPSDNISLAESYVAVFLAIIMLGSPHHPKNVSTRIIFLW